MKLLSGKYPFKKLSVRILVWLFDSAGSLLFFWLRRPFSRTAVRRILAVRLDQVGDVVMTLPCLNALRECFPDAQIDYLAAPWAAEIVRSHPALNETIVYDNSFFSTRRAPFLRSFRDFLSLSCRLRGRHYDLAVDFRGDLRVALLLFLSGVRHRVGRGGAGGGFLFTKELAETPSQHQWDRNMECVRALGCGAAPAGRLLYYPPSSLGALQEKFGDHFLRAPRPWIVIHAGSGYPSKRWPAPKFFELTSQLLKNTRGSVWMIGQVPELELVRPYMIEDDRLINAIGKTSLPELCALIEAGDLFVGNDSGPSHIAAALGKKVLVIFSGTNDYRVWQPRGPHVRLIRTEVTCSPCHERTCPLPRHDCVEDITVDQVLASALSALQQRSS